MRTLKIAFRTLTRLKLYSLISILGLALSLACFIFLAGYINQELTVNHFIDDREHLYFLTEHKELESKVDLTCNINPNGIDPLDDPAIIETTLFAPLSNDHLFYKDHKYNVRSLIIDDNFLSMVNFPIISGNPDMSDRQGILITEDFAKKIFGDEEPLGKEIEYSSEDKLIVTGIIGKPVTKCSFVFDVMVPMKLQQRWSAVFINLVRIASGTDINELNKRNDKYVSLGYWGEFALTKFQFFPLNKFYLNKVTRNYSGTGIFLYGNRENISIISIVALCILIIGIINFINLYTVNILKRSREFGVKKVYGAGKTVIFQQLYIENCLLIIFSVFLGWLFIEIITPVLDTYLELSIIKDIKFNIFISLALLIGLSFLTTLFPYFRYSYRLPVHTIRKLAFKNKWISSRDIFLTIQYMLTFMLIVSSLFSMKQLNYMLNMDLNYKTSNTILCKMLYDKTVYDDIRKWHWKQIDSSKIIKEKMNASSLFTGWLSSDALPYNLFPSQLFKKEDGKFHEMAFIHADNNYFHQFGFELLEGRFWNEDMDGSDDYKIIINESAKKIFEIDDITSVCLQPKDRHWWSHDEEEMSLNPPYEIMGVIKDFKTGHLSFNTPPVVIFYDQDATLIINSIIAKVIPGKEQEAITFLSELYQEINGKSDFEYTFLEDKIATLYEDDKRIARIYNVFSFIAIFISCLGLMGLSLYDIQQRYREIAIRKVNGASITEIMMLLLKKYASLLLISFLIATPVCIWALNKYLENVAHHTPVSWWLFGMAFLITSTLSFMVVIFQIKKAAGINPIQGIKTE